VGDKPVAEQTAEERIKSLDKVQNVLNHPDWREVYLMFNDAAAQAQHQMDDAPDWDTFVAARAVKLYIQTYLLDLRERVKLEKEELEADMSAVTTDTPPEDL